MTAIAFYAGGIALALPLGLAFVRLWRLCVPRGAMGGMVAELTGIAQALSQTDDVDDFLALYKRLLVNAGSYLARNLGGLVLCCLPIGLALALLAPPLLDAWDRQSAELAGYPAVAASAVNQALVQRPAERGEPGTSIDIGGVAVPLHQPYDRLAICWSIARCTLFRLLGFEVREVEQAATTEAPFIVIRPSHGDDNVLWPYLSDLEFTFWAAFMLATCGGFLLPRRRR